MKRMVCLLALLVFIGIGRWVASTKVFVDLGCSSHMALWEKNHLLLFRASLEWLTKGSVNGTKKGCCAWDINGDADGVIGDV